MGFPLFGKSGHREVLGIIWTPFPNRSALVETKYRYLEAEFLWRYFIGDVG